MFLLSFLLIANAQSSWWWKTTTTTTPGQAPVVTTIRSDTPLHDDTDNKGKTEKQEAANPGVSNTPDPAANSPDISPPPTVQAPVPVPVINNPSPALIPSPALAPVALATQPPAKIIPVSSSPVQDPARTADIKDDSKQAKETPTSNKTAKTTISTPPKNETAKPPKSSNAGAVVGGVCGAIGGIILLFIITAKYMKRKPKYSDSYLDPEGSYDSARRISVVPDISHYSSHYYNPDAIPTDELPVENKFQYQYSSAGSSNSDVSEYTQSTQFTNYNSTDCNESQTQYTSTVGPPTNNRLSHFSNHEYYSDPMASVYSTTESVQRVNSAYQANSFYRTQSSYEEASLPGSEICDNYNAQSVYYEQRPP